MFKQQKNAKPFYSQAIVIIDILCGKVLNNSALFDLSMNRMLFKWILIDICIHNMFGEIWCESLKKLNIINLNSLIAFFDENENEFSAEEWNK